MTMDDLVYTVELSKYFTFATTLSTVVNPGGG